MGTATFLLVLALAASQATAVNILVPVGKELIYDYQSVVKAGILTGTSYGSLFVLRGQLIVFGLEDMIECRLRNLTYTLHNGEVGVDTTIPLTETTVPYEVEDLMKPFRIQYDVEGKVMGIYTDVTELEYSKNIKRALATILQLDRRVKYGCTEGVCSFVTMEDSIYGMDKVNYNVMLRDDHDIVVQKMLERTSTRQLYQHVITNIFKPTHLFHVEHPLVRDCQKKYVIGTYNGLRVIKKITSEGGIYFTPFRTLSDTQYLLVTQTLRLIDITHLTHKTFVTRPHFIKTLKYHIDHDYIKYGMIPDVRMVTDVKTIYPIVYTMLKEIVIKLGSNPILETRPDIYKTQLINRLHDLLIRLDVVTMKELYTLLCEKHTDMDVLEVFYQFLPLVGTRASVILIKDLILEKRVSERIMLHFLHVFPFHVRVCTGKLLLEVEDLLMLKKDFTRTVYRAAILSYTTLIRRVRENIKNSMMFTVMHGTDVTHYMTKIDTICEKYLHYLINRLMTCTEYDLQQIYITGIFNTKLRMAGMLLRKFMMDTTTTTIHHNLRINMMWTVGTTLKDTDDVYTVFWPILTNRHLHLEYRGLALYILLKTHPTTTRLLNLVWYMDTERNTELYNIYYTYLHTILRTTDVTKLLMKERVVKIIRLVRRPDVRSRSGFFALDYKDPIHNFGCTFNTFMMVTDRSQYIKIITHGHLLGIPINYLNIVFRIEGLTIPLTEIIDINRLLMSRTSLFNTDEIMKLVTVLKAGGVKMEVDILVQEQVIFCKYFDKTNLVDLWRIVSDMSLFTLMKEYLVKINYNIYTTIMLPTDMGTLGMLDVKIPTIRKHLIDVKHDFTGGKMMVDMDVKLRESIRTTYGLTMYNPIVNVWQGVRKVKLMDVVIPFKMGFLFDMNTRIFKIVFKRTHDVTDTVGLRTYVTGFVFLTKDIIHHRRTTDYDVNTRDLVVVRRDILHKEHVIVDRDDINTGLNYQVLTVDCDRPFTHSMVRKLFKVRRTFTDKNYHTNMGFWFLVMQNMYDYFVVHPCEGTCGLVFRGLPSKVYPVGEMDLTFKFIPDVMITRDILLPGLKLDSRITYTVKTMDMTPLKTIDLNMFFDVNEGQTLSNLKMMLTVMRRGHKDERVLIEGTKKWTDRDVIGHLKVIYGTTGVTEEPVMVFNMRGGLLTDQTVGTDIKYGRCDLGVAYHPFKCLRAMTSLRKFDYDIKMTKRVPYVIRTLLEQLLIELKVRYDYDIIDTKDIVVPDDTIKVRVTYPLIGKVMDLKVLTTTEKFTVTNIPVRDIKWFRGTFEIGLTPMFLVFDNYDVNDILIKGITWLGHGKENTRISPNFKLLRKWGITNTCKVTPYTLRKLTTTMGTTTTRTTTMMDGWHMLIGEVAHKTGIFVKRLDVHDLLVLKLVLKDTKLEIVPVGDGMYKFIHNGVVVPFDKIYRTRGTYNRGFMYDRVMYDDVVMDKSFMTDRVGDLFHIKKRGIYGDDYTTKFDDKVDFLKYKKYGMIGDKFDTLEGKYGKDVDFWMRYKEFLMMHKIPFTTKYVDMFKDRYFGRYGTDSTETTTDFYDTKYRTTPFTKKYFGRYGMDTTDTTTDFYDTKYRTMPWTKKYFGRYGMDTTDTTTDFYDTKYRTMPWTKKYFGRYGMDTTDTTTDFYDTKYKTTPWTKDMKHKTPWKRDTKMFDTTKRFDSKEYIDSIEHFTNKKTFDRLNYKMPWLTKMDKFTDKHFYDTDSTEKFYGTKGMHRDFDTFGTKDWTEGSTERFDYVKKPWMKTMYTDKLYDTTDYTTRFDTTGRLGSFEKFTTTDDYYRFPWMKKRFDTTGRVGTFDKFTTKGNFFDTKKRFGSTERFTDSTEHFDFMKKPWMKKYYTNTLYDTDTTKFMHSNEFIDTKERLMKNKMPWMTKDYRTKYTDTLFDTDSMEKFLHTKEHFTTPYDVDSTEYMHKDTLYRGKTTPYRKYDTFMYKTDVDTTSTEKDWTMGRTFGTDMGTKDKTYYGYDKYIRDNTCWGVHCLTRIVTGTYKFGGVTVDIVGRTIFIATSKMTIFLEYNGRDVLIDYFRMKDYVGMCFDTVY